MQFTPSRIPGAWIIDITPIHDSRGFFAMTWLPADLRERGMNPALVQCNLAFNHKRGTLRVVVYIEPRRTFQYFVIPYAGWSVLTCKNGQDIRLSYNRQTGRVSKIWPFEVSSFAQLCGDVRSRILDQWQGWELHPWPTQAPFRSLQSWYTAPFSDVGAPVLQQWTHIDDASPLVSPAR